MERSRGADESAYVAVRLRATLPEDAPMPTFQRRDRAFVIDVSHSQSRESLQTQLALTAGLLRRMDLDERFVLLACDSACATYPATGLSLARRDEIDAALAWLNERPLGGASDIAGALLSASRRLEPDGAGQLVFFGDGAATTGELSADAIADRVTHELERREIDLRFLGVGRSVDGQTMGALAATLGGSYEPIAPNVAPNVLVEALAMDLRAPVVVRPELELPAHLTAVYPPRLPNLRLGQEVIVLAKLGANRGGDVVLRGKLEGRPYESASTLNGTELLASQNSLVPRLWAERRIAELQRSRDGDAVRETIELSQRHHVMSRHTALLVLENERMYREFGIKRTQQTDGKEGGTGQRRGRQTLNRFGIAGPADHPDPDIARQRALRDAAEFGMIGALNAGASGDPDAPNVPWGRDDSLGTGPMSAKGSMWGNLGGDSAGAGGLGLSGIGTGGSGRGEGIGLGSIGTIGRGAGTGTGQGFGSGNGRLGRSSRARPPRVRMGATSVSGRLPPEVIQRIVRQNFGRFRLCYENGLRNNPSLQGRVSVRFVIARNGSVTNVGGSGDIPDAGVISCVTRAFYGLSFPQPEGGIVTVSYPIVFTPGDGDGSSSPAWRTPVMATHQAGDESWREGGLEGLTRLRVAVGEQPKSRRAHAALVRGMLGHGRFPMALEAARQFVALDPDMPGALRLLAYAAAANGDGALAARSLSSEVELQPGNASLQRRAAKAFEARGDEPRACAHWRAAAQLDPRSEPSRYESLRCRARVEGDRDAVLARASASAEPSKRIDELVAQLTLGASPAHDGRNGRVGWFEAKLDCSGDRCPAVVVVAPNGTVYSPWTPAEARSDSHSVALTRRRGGTYRTLVVGPPTAGMVELRLVADNAVRKFPVDQQRMDGPVTVAVTHVRSYRGGWGRF
ncbi:MAG: AgmX/PglI C-terminal domain-containing protein [Deltaproteobacteria bacterium]|nr:AgmX/PglI C-terminal domain-containing protein [Deltaproteobacteria bacterium]